MLYSAIYQSPLGKIVLLSDEQDLLGLWFHDQQNYGAQYNLHTTKIFQSRPIKLATKWMQSYFQGQNPDARAIPIKPEVTIFRQQVLQELQQIPYGQTATYKQLSDRLQPELATKINKARAIGNAVGHNPISLIIPCHRVLGTDGSLTGYAGGLDRKKALLKLENNQQV